jgi:alcohol dehydrogenase class IV
MNSEYELLYPALIRFGWGVREDLPEIIDRVSGQDECRVLTVCSASVARSETGASLLKQLEPRCGSPFTGIPHDPSLAVVEDIVAAARKREADVVVGIGGGSVIDAAKAAAVLTPLDGSVREFFHQQRTIVAPGIPFIALPTTAGTGAEITKNSVLTDQERHVKKSLRSPHMVPAAAVIDPEFTLSLSPEITAASGLDAFTQAVESYISAAAHTVSRALALKAVGRLARWLPTAYADRNSREARTHVAEGSLLSAMAFSQSGLGAVHGLAHPLGLALDLPHGLTCAVLLPHVLRWNRPACENDYETLATAVGAAGAEDFVEAVERLCSGLGIPGTFATWGLAEHHFQSVVANCRSGSMKANPRPMSDRDVLDLLAKLV